MPLVDRTLSKLDLKLASKFTKTAFYTIKLILYSPKEPSISMFNFNEIQWYCTKRKIVKKGKEQT